MPYLKSLVDYWLNGFDWRAQESRLNRLTQFKARVDGLDIHFVHEKGRGPSPKPLILTHGWPGSFLEFETLIPMLVDPAAYGADPSDSFDVVIPSLPGYAFSEAPKAPGMNTRAIADIWRKLMTGLGYDRFGAQGGDIGAGVSFWLARNYPADLIGLHVNYIPASFRSPSPGGTPPKEDQAYRERVADWLALEGGYSHLQATKPQTLAFALSDSPAGLAAYLVEKFRTWSDSSGDIASVFSKDELLTNICLYWFSNSLEASLRLYKENRQAPLAFETDERVKVPLGVAMFPRELPTPPRSWVENVFDVQRWSTLPRGGHFAALEQPTQLASEIRTFFRTCV